jgi:hypothetical protein
VPRTAGQQIDRPGLVLSQMGIGSLWVAGKP